MATRHAPTGAAGFHRPWESCQWVEQATCLAVTRWWDVESLLQPAWTSSIEPVAPRGAAGAAPTGAACAMHGPAGVSAGVATMPGLFPGTGLCCQPRLPTTPAPQPARRSVAVVRGLVGALLGHVDVLGLLVRQHRQPGAQGGQVERGHLLVEVLGQHVHLALVLRRGDAGTRKSGRWGICDSAELLSLATRQAQRPGSDLAAPAPCPSCVRSTARAGR